MNTLSGNRKGMLYFMDRSVSEKGYAPSVRDVVKGCGISSSFIAQYHLNVLEREGYIRHD